MDEGLTPLEMLLVIAVGSLIRNQSPRRREAMLADINRKVGNPRVLPFHDGDHLRMSRELRSLFERLLETWL